MKYLLTLACVLAPILLVAQDYTMYETNYLNVQPGHQAEFAAAMKAHNDQFHAEAPYRAVVHYVVNGPRTGQFSWLMGPTTFTHLDGRPSGDDHTSDWTGNVLVHTDGTGYNEYWRRVDERSHIPDTLGHPIIRVRFYDVADGERYRFNKLMEQVRDVLVATESTHRWSFYDNRFWSDDGRDVAIVTSYDMWADLDEESTFVADFKATHGEGSWVTFLEEWEDAVDGAWDEYRSFIPGMSGGDFGDD